MVGLILSTFPAHAMEFTQFPIMTLQDGIVIAPRVKQTIEYEEAKVMGQLPTNNSGEEIFQKVGTALGLCLNCLNAVKDTITDTQPQTVSLRNVVDTPQTATNLTRKARKMQALEMRNQQFINEFDTIFK